MSEFTIPPTDRNGASIKRNDRVRIFKGTPITGTFSGPKPKLAGTTYTVRVRNTFNGWAKISDHRDDAARAPQVSWAGAGGYWHDCDAALVEVVK